MIKLTHRLVATHVGFAQAVQKLLRHPFPLRTAYRLGKTWEAIDKERQKIQKEFQTLAHQFSKKDAEGKIVLSEDGNFEIEEANMPAFQAAEKAFGDTEFTVDREPMAWSELGADYKMSAAEMSAIESLFEPLDVIEAPKTLSAVK